MRITNKIMQRNNLANINNNKVYQDKLSNQMSTQKKINRPSDDPVVAIRALRLRSDVTEITQYYSKNIPDAESWLNVTEDALKNQAEIMTDMIKQCTRGANGDLTNEDRTIILEQLQALSSEVYSTANADYAGRYVFTGYRTDIPLSFLEGNKDAYEITEQIHKDSLQTITQVNTGDVLDLNVGTFATMTGVTEDTVSSVSVHRIQLAYNDCSLDKVPTIEFADGRPAWDDIQIVHALDDPYSQIAENPNAVYYVPETGEILLGENRYADMISIEDDATTNADESEIRVKYTKENWIAGDLRPEHYFACYNATKDIEYNMGYLDGTAQRQDIEYDVGFNQTVRVNSTADECFKHGIGRAVDDIVAALQDVTKLETVQGAIETAMKTATGDELATLNKQLDATKKAITLSKDKCQKLFESSITKFQDHLNQVNLSITNCGNRSSKLDLIKNRMQSQKTTFETLKSENEDIDITEVAIQLSSAELTYEAALMATGKVMQTTLLSYI